VTAEPGELLDQALRLCQAGALKQAEQIYRRIVVSHPEATDAWNMLAVVLYELGELEEAAYAALQATERRPRIAPYWLSRGNIEMARHQQGEAQASFKRAIALEPAFAEAHYRLGMSYHRDCRFGDAAAAYRDALRFAPSVPEISWRLGEALLSESDAGAAMRAFQDAFAQDPHGVLDRRGCFDWMGRMQFDSLPEFWHAEILRFFQREDLNRAPFVRVALKALKTKRSFRALLESPTSTDSASGPDARNVTAALGDPLFHAVLREGLIADADFEFSLTRLRARLLFDTVLRAQVSLDFLCAFALQCFNNEFVYAQNEREQDEVDRLLRSTESELGALSTPDEGVIRPLLTVACYRSLDGVRGIEAVLEPRQTSSLLDLLLQRTVVEVREERSLRRTISGIGAIADTVSHAVRGMYEQNPYPRWFAVDREPALFLSEWLERELPAQLPIATASTRILVAGCGTGQDAIWLATHIRNSKVLAVDLSLSSLSYAQRMARKLDVRNVEFRHGDILSLAGLSERFDMIASTGVLHHMREPQKGLLAIAGLLRPGGLMKLGLYSARARVSVSAARRLISEQQIASTEAAIREFRQHVLGADSSSALWELRYSLDFYSMSMCRDLLFHLEEHQYGLPEIAVMLQQAELTFLGLSELPQDAVAAYRRMFPEDRLMTNMTNWDAFEARYPDTFSNMFLFWCRKPDHAAH